MRLELFEHIEPNFMTYAMTTIVDRALPDVRDGFKPVHRKILYSMFNKGILSYKDRAKCSEPISETMKIHGHGDTSIYGALALMTESNESLLHPFIDGEGAFGKAYNRDNPSAARYTFCRLNKFAEDTLFTAWNKNVVDFVEESGHKRPIVLPNTFPNILVKPNSGIAVGMACNFPSFNLDEVCDTTVKILKCEDVLPIYPDFSTGSDCVENKIQVEKIFNSGDGKITLRAKYRFDEHNNCIEVYEIPFNTTVDEILDKIEGIMRSGRCKDIIDARDETGFDIKEKRDKLKIAIEIKKKSNPDTIINILFKLTPLESTFSANMNCLVNNRPQVLGVKAIIGEWIKFRKTCLKRELQYDIDNFESEYNKLKGLEIILSDLDKAISIIRSSKSEKEAMIKLTDYFKLNQAQVEYICTIKLINMNEEWLHNKISKLDDMTNSLTTMNDNINDDNYYTQTIINQLEEVKKKYGQPRKTTIIYEDEIEAITNQDLIENYNLQIVLTKQGYLKKTLRFSDTQKAKEGDTVLQQIPSTNKSKLLFFTDKANCYYLNVYDLETTQPSNLGVYLPSMLQLQDENVIHVISTEDFKGYVLFAFENGKVAKINLSSYETKTNRTKSINAYNTSSPLISIRHIEKDCDFQSISSINKVLVFNTSQINSKGSKASQGVNVLKSKNNSTVVEFKPCEIDNPEYYRGNIPGVGCYRKEF